MEPFCPQSPCGVAKVYGHWITINCAMWMMFQRGKALGWEPQVTFGDLVRLMVDADMELLKEEHGL
jgi:GDP-D-mannose dehydratase